MRGVLFFGLTWITCLAWYQLLAGSPSVGEICAGVPAATGGAILAMVLRRRSRRFAYPRGAVRAALRSVGAILPDSMRVGRGLLAAAARGRGRTRGHLATQPFRSGSDAGQDASRRALVILGGSLSPNGFVLDAPPDSRAQAIRIHQLCPMPPKPDAEWPV